MKLFFGFISLLLLLLASSCTNNYGIADATTTNIQLSAQFCYDTKHHIWQAWEGTEEFGVYLIDSHGENSMSHELQNKRCVVGNDGLLITFANKITTQPLVNENAQFISYFPYTTRLINHHYPIDLTNKDVVTHDFIYATALATSSSSTINLIHHRQLSTINIAIKDATGAFLTNAEISIERPVKALFNLLDGVMNVDESTLQLLSYPLVEGRVKGFVLPYKGGRMIIKTPQKCYIWNMVDVHITLGEDFEYTLELIPGSGNVSVNDWVDVDGGILFPTPI